ncbi:hypothetical protein MASR2M15_20060 [Anaerolineales bacterium]
MQNSFQSILAKTELIVDEQDYRFISLPPNAIILAAGIIAEAAIPFCSLIVDELEITLILAEDVIEEFSSRLKLANISEEKFSLITFNVELDFSVVGFMAQISQSLAAAEVSIMAISAYKRDHILVNKDQLDLSMKTLSKLKTG